MVDDKAAGKMSPIVKMGTANGVKVKLPSAGWGRRGGECSVCCDHNICLKESSANGVKAKLSSGVGGWVGRGRWVGGKFFAGYAVTGTYVGGKPCQWSQINLSSAFLMSRCKMTSQMLTRGFLDSIGRA